MNLTNEELITLVETHNSQCLEFEKDVVNYTNIERWELEKYLKNAIIVKLGSMKFNNLTVDEVLEHYLTNLHK